MSFERGTFFLFKTWVRFSFIWADNSAFHSRFFCSSSFRKKELRSSRAANPDSIKPFYKFRDHTILKKPLLYN